MDSDPHDSATGTKFPSGASPANAPDVGIEPLIAHASGPPAVEGPQELSGDAILHRLSLVIESLTAQIQQMQTPTVKPKEAPVLPWYPTAEERYPPKDPAKYTEFEKKYPPDRFGEEAADDARVWKIYRDRANELDQDKIEGWSKTLDILLIFAGLFSAVITAFLIESYKQLQPDYTEYLVLAFIAAQANTTFELPAAFVSTTLSLWTNGLWFVSLSLALCVALLAILSKQWLEYYVSNMRSHVASNRRWAWRHMFYSAGLTKWGLDILISTLPVMMHVALSLFFAGLVLFLWPISKTIALILAAGSAVVFVAYILVGLLPIWFRDCPTATPLLRYIYGSFRPLAIALYSLVACAFNYMICCTLSTGMVIRLQAILDWLEGTLPSPTFSDTHFVEGDNVIRDSKAILWMVSNLPVAEEVAAAVECIGGLPLRDYHNPSATTWYDYDIFNEPAIAAAWRAVCIRLSGEGVHADPQRVARLLRAGLLLPVRLPSRMLDYLESVERSEGMRRYDMQLTSSICSYRSLGHIVPTGDWHDVFSSMTEPCFHPSTINLLAHGVVRMKLEDCAVAFGCGLTGISSLPFTQYRVMWWGLSRILDNVQILSRTLAPEHSPPLHPSGGDSTHDLCVRALSLWCDLLNRVEPRRFGRATEDLIVEAFCCSIRESAKSSRERSKRLPPQALEYITSTGFARLTLTSSTLRDLLHIISLDMHPLLRGDPPYRDHMTELYVVLAAVLRKCRLCPVAEKTMFSGVIDECLVSASYHFVLELLPPDKIDHGIVVLHPFSDSPTDGSPDSVWRMALELSPPQYLTSVVALRHIETMLELHRRGKDVSKMLDEVVGDDRGQNLILSHLPTGYDIATASKALSPEWWHRARKALLALPAETWAAALQRDRDGAHNIATASKELFPDWWPRTAKRLFARLPAEMSAALQRDWNEARSLSFFADIAAFVAAVDDATYQRPLSD